MYIEVVYSYMLMDLVCAWILMLWIKGSAVHGALVHLLVAYMRLRIFRKLRRSYTQKAYIKKGRKMLPKKKIPMVPGRSSLLTKAREDEEAMHGALSGVLKGCSRRIE